MRLNVYTIFDTASGMFDMPLVFRADGEALRWFSNLTQNAETKVGQNPEDFTFFRIGTYDDNKGKLVGEAPECMATAMEMVAKARQIEPGKLVEFDKEMSAGGTDRDWET